MERLYRPPFKEVSPTLRSDAGDNQPSVAFAQNQREEVRDLNGVASALNAERRMHEQTSIAYEKND